MIVVTGGAGMIGANLVHALNAAGERDILVVDDLTDGRKFRNLLGAQIADYEDKDEFLNRLRDGREGDATVIFHQGACSETTEWNGQLMMATNFSYSKAVFEHCQRRGIPMIYASSAAVYGNSRDFAEQDRNERPLNVYGWSKKLFDDWVRRRLDVLTAPVVGLRYFNVYGPREDHKGKMASVAYHLYQQARRGENLKLFGAYDGIAAGQQSRDFVHVDDVVAVNLWAWRSGQSGIFNCGTGRSQPFIDVANALIGAIGAGPVEFIDFPAHLQGSYQNYTRASLDLLRGAGFSGAFRDVQAGVALYANWLGRDD